MTGALAAARLLREAQILLRSIGSPTAQQFSNDVRRNTTKTGV
jgi:hypothetical protein